MIYTYKNCPVYENLSEVDITLMGPLAVPQPRATYKAECTRHMV